MRWITSFCWHNGWSSFVFLDHDTTQQQGQYRKRRCEVKREARCWSNQVLVLTPTTASNWQSLLSVRLPRSIDSVYVFFLFFGSWTSHQVCQWFADCMIGSNVHPIVSHESKKSSCVFRVGWCGPFNSLSLFWIYLVIEMFLVWLYKKWWRHVWRCSISSGWDQIGIPPPFSGRSLESW